jgi:hypothetical protein
MAFFTGCDFINLEPIGFSTNPGINNTILPEDTTVLSVSFDTSMDKLETQKSFSVRSAGGTVKGDLSWQGDTLFFTPLEPWLPGVRYTLSLDGIIYSRDGREERISHYVAFYALTTEAAPYGLAFTPADGASVGVSTAEGAFVRIVFSQPMDRQSTADALSIDGVSEKEYHWFDDDTVVELYPKNNLNPWTIYHWSLSSKARGRSGVPLGREISAQFVTDADRLLPAVSAVYPLIRGYAPGTWVSTGAEIEDGLGSGQAIGIEFTKPMDESVLRNIRFEPPLAGRTEMWNPAAVVFIPDRDLEPERIYTLYVSADSRDTAGLKMEREYAFSLTANIPYLTLLSLDAGSGELTPEQNGIYPAVVMLPEGIITVTLRFSHALNIQSQAAAVLGLSLSPYFPGTLGSISLRSAGWWSSDTLILQWEGIEKSLPGERHYYRLLLPGGRGGISDGTGSYLKEDNYFFIEGAP